MRGLVKRRSRGKKLFDRVVSILEAARTHVVRSVNSQMVAAYWLIGREIVEEEQKGKARAEYGKRVVEELSRGLTERYGAGFSVANLWLVRQFYQAFPSHRPILDTVYRESSDKAIPDTVCRESPPALRPIEGPGRGFHPDLGWSHYRVLMRVENPSARDFYEREAADSGWSVRELKRQVHSLFYERLLKSRDKAGMLQLARHGQAVEKPVDVIKDPYVLEFLDLPESPRLAETDLETALISRLQEFLLELGAGFAFIGRQKRLTLEGDHFYPDLVFYQVRLKCYVVIDLKVGKLSPGDLAQVQMYVNYYDREVRTPEENPTVGLILCAEKNDAVVRYVLGEGNQRIFASRYRLALPSEEELRRELERERRLVVERSHRQ